MASSDHGITAFHAKYCAWTLTRRRAAAMETASPSRCSMPVSTSTRADRCRTPQAIDAAFAALRVELDVDDIHAGMQETERLLLTPFDADIHNLLRSHQERVES